MIRWYVKKAARTAVAGICWASGSLLVRRWSGIRPRVRVLTYHRVRDARREPFSVTVQEFERQMAWLAAQHVVISLADLEKFLSAQLALPADAVLVTIDDGYEDLQSAALPVLVKYGIPAVAFITAGEMDGAKDPDADRKLTASEVAELTRHGVSIGSHAWDHRSLGRMSPENAADQATASKAALEQVTGGPVTAFAYPYGTRLDFNASTGAGLRSAGYQCAFTSQHGAVTRDSDPMELPRIKIEGGDPSWVFRVAARGGLDVWALVDRLCASFQATDRGPVAPRVGPPPARHASASLSGRSPN